ncbi:MAG: hypothetical protein IPP93_02105 [Chitinophagaceae bacterium]|nr:hypothetical protein [Chitinophagaceae bacterium]MBL0336450.1 hypothetical protein [Chitinophagaceae bacterium]
MTKKLIAAFLFATVILSGPLSAQDAVQQEGEFGFGLGAGHYFGDLNTRARLNRAKLAGTIFFRKNLGNYIAARVGASFAQLGYSDQYNTHNTYMYTRNLSFNTKVWELALQADFNFFRFMPGDPAYAFTPYITMGVGIFSFDPYAYLKGEKVYLRQLGTEGQGSSLYPDRKPYSSMSISIPFGGGIKYAFNDRVNICFEVLHRFTNTDYLDDVSKTYVDPAVFPANPDGSPSNGLLLSDRSYELGEVARQINSARGMSKQKDQFVTAMVHLTFNLQSYKCPSAY